MFVCDGVFSACLRRSATLICCRVCHDLEMMVIYDMLSPTPDVATGTSLSPWLSQKQDTVSGWNVALQSQASTVSEAHLFPYLYLAVSLLTH
jgi:hypothetical protein